MPANTPPIEERKLQNWEHPQPIAQYARTFRGREWVPLEMAEAKLQWWQKRDFENGETIAKLEADGPLTKLGLLVREGGEEVEKAAVEQWQWFLDANPSDVTSPEDYPDHALVTFDEFKMLFLRTLQGLVK